MHLVTKAMVVAGHQKAKHEMAEHQIAEHETAGRGTTVVDKSEQSTDEPCHSSVPPDTSHCASDAHGAASDAPSDTSSCGACSGCCVVHIALPITTFRPPDSPAPRIASVMLPDLFTDHVALTPKRPPRSYSA